MSVDMFGHERIKVGPNNILRENIPLSANTDLVYLTEHNSS